ncbi:hypothetical protein ACO0R3_004006 [Hanseniaspora guilliermondii]
MTNTIVNHFNDVLCKSQFDIINCVEVDKEYIVFDLRYLFPDTNKNFFELREILSNYKIIFNTETFCIQFTPLFKLVQEILLYNYNHFIKSAKNRSNCNNQDHSKVLFILNQFFKHPFISENSLNHSVVNSSSNLIKNTTKLSKLLELNYDLLPENFASSPNESNINKIRGGKVKYQGTWVTCSFGIKLMKLIGCLDVLNQLLSAIFKFLSIDFKSYLNHNNQTSKKITFALNTKSVVWNHFPINYVKLREYRSDSRVGKKRGRYNKAKKHTLDNLKPLILKHPPIIESKEEVPLEKPTIKLPPIILDPLKLQKKISYRSLSNQDFLNKIAHNHIQNCNLYAFKNEVKVKNLSAGSDKYSSFTKLRQTVSPSLLSVCNLQYNNLKTRDELSKEDTFSVINDNGTQRDKIKISSISMYSDSSITPLPSKMTHKELQPPFSICRDTKIAQSSPQILPNSHHCLSYSVTENDYSINCSNNSEYKLNSPHKEKIDMSNKTLVNRPPEVPISISTHDSYLLEKINEPFDYQCFSYDISNVQVYNNFGYKISTRRQKTSSYNPVSYEDNIINKACQRETLTKTVDNMAHQSNLVGSLSGTERKGNTD